MDVDATNLSYPQPPQFTTTTAATAPNHNSHALPPSSATAATGTNIIHNTFGLIVPGQAVRTEFCDAGVCGGRKLSMTISSLSKHLTSVTELVLFLLPGVVLPDNHGALCYWQVSAVSSNGTNATSPGFAASSAATASTGFELLGALTTEEPSKVFRTGWSENEQLVEMVQQQQQQQQQNPSATPSFLSVTIGISIEPMSTVQNLTQSSSSSGSSGNTGGKLWVAQRIASDLFNYMRSFDTGTGSGSSNTTMMVPTNIFDRWFQRFEARVQRDPHFFLKQHSDA